MVQIGEFARRAGVSARALRHYEEQGLLRPERTHGGYREYADSDLVTVRRIRRMMQAGLSTRVARQYLDCIRAGDNGVAVDMCPALRSELDAVGQRLDDQSARIDATRAALCELGRE